ncbi:uncharacterized, partial [Tachysurus ichikawai]
VIWKQMLNYHLMRFLLAVQETVQVNSLFTEIGNSYETTFQLRHSHVLNTEAFPHSAGPRLWFVELSSGFLLAVIVM